MTLTRDLVLPPCVCTCKNHNSLGHEQPSDLHVDVKQSPNAQYTFQPMPGLISCTGVTRSVGITHHAHATEKAGLYTFPAQGQGQNT